MGDVDLGILFDIYVKIKKRAIALALRKCDRPLLHFTFAQNPQPQGLSILDFRF